MTTYTITILESAALNALMEERGEAGGPVDAGTLYGGKTYTGFTLLEKGSFTGGYQGTAEGDEVIFYGDEVQDATPE